MHLATKVKILLCKQGRLESPSTAHSPHFRNVKGHIGTLQLPLTTSFSYMFLSSLFIATAEQTPNRCPSIISEIIIFKNI